MSIEDGLELEATFVNRAHCVSSPEGLRLMLGDSPDAQETDEIMRYAFFIPHRTALAIVRMLTEGYGTTPEEVSAKLKQAQEGANGPNKAVRPTPNQRSGR